MNISGSTGFRSIADISDYPLTNPLSKIMNTAEQQAHFPNKIAEIESLPPFPLLANIIKAFVIAENNGDIRPLIDNIETEPSIVAKVIGVANSAAYGNQHHPVRSIKEAIIILGMIQLKSLVFGFVVDSRFNSRKCPAFDTGRFWRNSMYLAYCASLMVDYCENAKFNRNEVYSIALVLRIGLLALVHVAPKEMHDVLSKEYTDNLLRDERKVFYGIDHFDAGAILLNHWNLPEQYWSATAHVKDELYFGDHYKMIILLRRARELMYSDFTEPNSVLDQELGLSANNIEAIADGFENDKGWILTFAEHF